MFRTRSLLGAVLFAVINCLLGSLQAQQVTFWVDTFTVTIVRGPLASSNATGAWWINGIRTATDKTFNSGGPGAGERVYTYNTTTRSANPVDNVRLVLNVIENGTEVPFYWKQARKDGDAANPDKEGPFEGGIPVNKVGEPVDPSGNPMEPPPKRYKAYAEWVNTNSVPATVEWQAVHAEGTLQVGSDQVQPGTKWSQTMYWVKPFKITYQPFLDGAPTQDPVEVPANEEDPATPWPPLPKPGDPGYPGGPKFDIGKAPGQNQVPTPDPVAPEPRPGDGEQNDEARHKEAMAQMGRIVDQINKAANQAAGDADIANDYLSGIKDNTEGMGQGGDEEGDGNADTANLEAIKGALTGGSGSVGAFEPGASAMGQGITTSTGNLVTALGNFTGALAIGSPGTQQLQWSIDLPEVGSKQINLEPYSSSFNAVRAIFLMVAGYVFWQAMVKTIRGAFADG